MASNNCVLLQQNSNLKSKMKLLRTIQFLLLLTLGVSTVGDEGHPR